MREPWVGLAGLVDGRVVVEPADDPAALEPATRWAVLMTVPAETPRACAISASERSSK
jgi:hypothetical protein